MFEYKIGDMIRKLTAKGYNQYYRIEYYSDWNGQFLLKQLITGKTEKVDKEKFFNKFVLAPEVR